MGLRRTKILVIDDNPEHGEKIAKSLWKSGSPVLYIHYSEQALIDKVYGEHSGVRVIFLDIDLRGAGLEGGDSHFYSPAQQALNTLLDSDNGPFALITWSSHDDKAEGLYQYLRQRLPEGKRPISLYQMDKDKLIQEDLEEEEKELKSIVLENLSKHNSLRLLTEWEGHVQNSCAALVKNLAAIADTEENENFDKNLECLLLQLARAEAGKRLGRSDDITMPLFNLMSTLLGDRLRYISLDKYSVESDSCESMDQSDMNMWKSSVNSFLHFETLESTHSEPGSLFNYPVDRSDLSIPCVASEDDMGVCVRAQFLDMRRGIDGYKERKNISKECELLLMDLTPPCDHSQKKVLWRRFVVVCKVPVKHKIHLWRIGKVKSEDGEGERKERIKGELRGDHLRLSPHFLHEDDEFVLVFNANLQSSIPEPRDCSEWESILGARVGRIREQLLSDFVVWLGSHITRGGIVNL